MGISSGRRGRLAQAGAIAGILVVAIFVIGIAGLAVELPGTGLRNWLVVLFGINAGFGNVSLGSLQILNPVDIAVLILASITFSGFWPGPGRPHKVWMVLAIALPLAGIAVLAATGQAGRSGLMGGGLVISFLMLGNRTFRPLGYLGIVANSLLLFGDFATGGSRAPIIAAVVAAGYLLLIAWFLWITARLLLPEPSSGVTRRT